jgi:hypothetical protein
VFLKGINDSYVPQMDKQLSSHNLMSKKIMNFLEQAYNKEKYLSFLKEKFNFSELLEPIEITPNGWV